MVESSFHDMITLKVNFFVTERKCRSLLDVDQILSSRIAAGTYLLSYTDCDTVTGELSKIV